MFNLTYIYLYIYIYLCLLGSDEKLTVQVLGQHPENFLFLIHETLEDLINLSYKGLLFDYLIPCPDCFNAVVSLVLFTHIHTRRYPHGMDTWVEHSLPKGSIPSRVIPIVYQIDTCCYLYLIHTHTYIYIYVCSLVD